MKLPRFRKRDKEVDAESVFKNLNRLDAVRRSGLVSKEPRANLDRLTKEASLRLHAQVGQITIIEDKRAVFASAFGKTGPLAEIEEIPISSTYCQHVVAYNDVLMVEDAATDPLGNQQGIKLGVRSYLGVPLRANGEVIGSMCVFDNKPRTWSDDDLNSLEEIAHEVMQHIDDQMDEDRGL